MKFSNRTNDANQNVFKTESPSKLYFSLKRYCHIYHLSFYTCIYIFEECTHSIRCAVLMGQKTHFHLNKKFTQPTMVSYHFYALHSLCSNFKLGIRCVYLYIAILESTCNCKTLGSDCVWTSGLTTCFQSEMKHHLEDLGFKKRRDSNDIL